MSTVNIDINDIIGRGFSCQVMIAPVDTPYINGTSLVVTAARTVVTNSAGSASVDLLPGNYTVTFKTDSIPDSLTIGVPDDSDTYDLTELINAGAQIPSVPLGNKVTGPASATDGAVALFDGITGKLIKAASQTIANLLARANHTGTQDAATIGDSTAAGRALLTASNAAAQRQSLELGNALDRLTGSNDVYVFEGDSLTDGYMVSAGCDYPTLAMAQPFFVGHGVKTTTAVHGSTLATMAARYTADVYPLRPTGSQRGYLFVWIGNNDIEGGSVSDTAAWLTDLASYWAAAQADGFRVVAFTIMPWGNSVGSKEIIRLALNKGIRQSSGWDYLFDVDQIFNRSSDTVYFNPDSLHLTDYANGLLAKILSAAMVNPSVSAIPLPYFTQGKMQVRVGSAPLTAALGAVDVIGDLFQFVGADNISANTLKTVRIGIPHYDITKTPIALIHGSSNSSSVAYLHLGGGSSQANAVTQIDFYTAANSTTTSGTLVGGVTSTGTWFFGSSSTSATAHIFSSSTAPSIRVTNVSSPSLKDGANFGVETAGGNLAVSTSAGDTVLGAKSGGRLVFATGLAGSNQSLQGYFTTGGDFTAATGNVIVTTAGKGLQLKSGTGARAGNATLVAGTVSITNTTVTANTLVMLTRKTASGTIGNLTYTLSAGASFTINSDSATDTSTVTYLLIELN